MKKSILVLTLSALAAALLSGCGESPSLRSSGIPDSSSPSSVSSSEAPRFDPHGYGKLVEKRVPVYHSSLTEGGSVVFANASTVKIYEVDGSSVPYVDVASYLEEFFPLQATYGDAVEDWTADYDQGVATITNPASGSQVHIDFASQTATYDNYDIFFNLTGGSPTDYFSGVIYGSLLDSRMTTYDLYRGKAEYAIDFGSYNLHGYLAEDGSYLLPYNLARILTNNYLLKENWLYSGGAFYDYYESPAEANLALNEALRQKGTAWLDQAYMQYDYDSLALFLDHFFGLDERQSRVEEGKMIHYLADGAYAMLAPYKERLLSTDLDVANDALLEVFANELDDGGHAKYASTNLLGTKAFTRLECSGPETKNTIATENGIFAARKKKGNDIASMFGPGVESPNGYYKEYNEGTTAYIQFDSFVGGDGNYEASEINEDNYYKDSITLFHYANERIQNNPSIKDVVIDLSGNGGGAVQACQFIASWISGGSEGSARNAKTGSMMEFHVAADVNLNGKFDSRDYLSEDIKVYLMISNGTFSSGNLLSCSVKDNRLANTYFIGSRTGGGSCAVGAGPFNILGGTPRLSSTLQLGRRATTKGSFVSNEAGVVADASFQIDNGDYDAFADLDGIMAKVKENRE